MSLFGEIIDDYDPQRESIYKIFSDYFNNPTMFKVKDTDKHSMYLSKLYCLLNRECRYIIIFTEKNNVSCGTPEELKNLEWVSFQTRTLPDNYENANIANISHGYHAIAEGPLMAEIERTNIKKEMSTYKCKEFPLIITLLHTQKNTPEAYQNKGTIIHALETFQTIITFAPVL